MNNKLHVGHFCDGGAEFSPRGFAGGAFLATRFFCLSSGNSSSSTTASQPVQTTSGGSAAWQTGNKSPVNTGSQITLSGKSAITVKTTTDLGSVAGALNLAGLAVASANSAGSAGVSSLSDLLKTQLANSAAIGTGGATTASKTFLVTVGLTIAAVFGGLWFWRKK